MKFIHSILMFFFVHALQLNGQEPFGYISYSTTNIGDDIQAIAAKRFLPKNSIPIDREFIGEFQHELKVSTIVNGWFMHTKDFCWYLNTMPPEKSWPPSDSINPLLISIHLTEKFTPLAFSDEGIAFFKKYGPVGARDYHTLQELQKRNIPSYFSGCLTLTLENKFTQREEIVYVVDLDEECINYIKANTHYKVKKLSHAIPFYLNKENRLQYAEKILEKYQKAKYVITSRLHSALPCLAFETPVLFVLLSPSSRFDGLTELTRTCSKEELLQGKADFDFNFPTENSKAYIPIRENIIKTVTDWVNIQSQ